MVKLGYLGIDQYGNKYTIDKHPRKELQEALGCKHVEKMYIDTKAGKQRHTGYVIGRHWINIYTVSRWKE